MPSELNLELRQRRNYEKEFGVRLSGVVAQLVERLVRNEKVAGSIPVGSTTFPGG